MKIQNYKLIYSNRKSIMLKIIDGKLCVYASRSVPIEKIESFIDKHKLWISKNINRQKNILNFVESFENDGTILLFGSVVDLPGREISQTDAAKKFYMDNRNYIVERANFLSKKYDVVVKKIAFSKSKTYWGVCNFRNEIRLNERLCSLPKVLIDYVILHELAHTVHHNHSKQFWDLLNSWIPNCKNLRKTLSEYTFVLNLYK